ncbi:MAG: phage morphogenesis protein [Bacteroidales bacterium]|nr:phage morphogenesis protein [Bacteroidales bacterium]
MHPLIPRILKDIKVELTDEFDRNFERKAFFNERWPARRFPNTKGSTLMVTGNLRASIRSEISGNRLRYTCNLPYAALHNNGGRIVVSAKMKKFFWAQYSKSKQSQWKAMALKRVGSQIVILHRQLCPRQPRTAARSRWSPRRNWRDFHKGCGVYKRNQRERRRD